MGNYNPEIFGHVTMAEFQVGTPCMCCGETVILNEVEARGVCLKLCDSCKEAILFAKEMKKSLTAPKEKEDDPFLVNPVVGTCPKCGREHRLNQSECECGMRFRAV